MRQYCKHCRYPLSQCLCDAILPVSLSAEVIVLQHPKEQQHAKNTARLAQLCSDRVAIVSATGASVEAFVAGILQADGAALVYPATHSMPVEQPQRLDRIVRQWVFLDGSWKQVYGMLQRFPVLQTLPCFHFADPPASGYAIRHTSKAQRLSTLEAIAYCMHTVYGDDTTAMLDLQQALTDRWQGPLTHRR